MNAEAGRPAIWYVIGERCIMSGHPRRWAGRQIMITRQVVSEKLLAYLNEEITLAELVDWAENCFVNGGFGPDEDVDMLADIVMYIAGADTAYFPLTWDVCLDFMKQLGTPIKVVTIPLTREVA